MDNLDYLTRSINNHLKIVNKHTTCWKIQQSSIAGRGVFANRDINVGEIIFVDFPLIAGPKAGKNVMFHCVVCTETLTRTCTKGCGLTVCENCENSEVHELECKFITCKRNDSIKNDSNETFAKINVDLFRALTPLRGFFLDKEQQILVNNLACHLDPPHGFEVNLVKDILNLSKEEQDYMKVVCGVLDSNAFETRLSEEKLGIRGLYPLASLMNHNCTPNTTHFFNIEKHMIVKASVHIKRNTEIFTTYISLLWGTSSRRHHLSRTKHFWCACDRCLDPKEFGTGLNGLKCVSPDCQGVLYAMNPLDDSCKWQCETCKMVVSRKKISYIQTALGSVLSNINLRDVNLVVNLLKNQLENIVPKRNQIVIETKMRLVWMLGHTQHFKWNELSDELLNLKEDICRDLLELLKDLRLGQCRMRGLLLMEFQRCLVEKSLRKTVTEDIKDSEDEQHEQGIILKEATDILRIDAGLEATEN